MLIHNYKLNPCKCGSTTMPNLDSDDMIPSWGVRCNDCNQFQHGDWSSAGSAVGVWNRENPSDSYFEIGKDHEINFIEA